MMTEFEKIQESTTYIRTRCASSPSIGIVLGTGVTEIDIQIDEVLVEIFYHDIPHFPQSTVRSHEKKLTIVRIGDKTVVVLHGRVHYYEGYSMMEVVRPIRILKLLGIKTLLMSNASGGLNESYQAGNLVFVKDHINLMPENPLRGKNIDELGVRFPDMSKAYSKELIQQAKGICNTLDIAHHTGVYCGLQGPNLETLSEYNYLKNIGGDLVGMSTVSEVIAGVHCGLDILVIAIVSNECHTIDLIQETTLESVIRTVKKAENKIISVFVELIKSL